MYEARSAHVDGTSYMPTVEDWRDQPFPYAELHVFGVFALQMILHDCNPGVGDTALETAGRTFCGETGEARVGDDGGIKAAASWSSFCFFST